MRHGEGVDDIEDRYGGWGDLPLSDKGREQAKLKLKVLKDLKIERVLSSPLKRAIETARIVAQGLGLKSEKWLYLKERNTYGLMSQEVKAEIKKKYPELHDAYEKDEYVMGSERYDDFVDRLKVMVQKIQEFPAEVVLALTHGVFLKAFCKEFLGKKLDKKEDGCLLEVDIEGDTVTFEGAEGLTFKE